jgi:hypothetical protein
MGAAKVARPLHLDAVMLRSALWVSIWFGCAAVLALPSMAQAGMGKSVKSSAPAKPSRNKARGMSNTPIGAASKAKERQTRRNNVLMRRGAATSPQAQVPAARTGNVVRVRAGAGARRSVATRPRSRLGNASQGAMMRVMTGTLRNMSVISLGMAVASGQPPRVIAMAAVMTAGAFALRPIMRLTERIVDHQLSKRSVAP